MKAKLTKPMMPLVRKKGEVAEWVETTTPIADFKAAVRAGRTEAHKGELCQRVLTL